MRADNRIQGEFRVEDGALGNVEAPGMRGRRRPPAIRCAGSRRAAGIVGLLAGAADFSITRRHASLTEPALRISEE